MALNNIATALALNGDCQQAEPLFREALDLAQRVQGRVAYMVAGPLHGLGQCWLRDGRRDEATDLFRESLAILVELGFGPGHPAVQEVSADLARATGGQP